MPIDWGGLRNDFEENGLNFSELSKKYGCAQSTIGKRARKEEWDRKSDDEVHSEQAASPDNVLDDHRKLWKGIKKRLVKGLETDDAKAGLEELKVAKIAGEVLSNVIKGERLAWGLEDGCSEGPTDDRDEIAAEMARATVSHGAGEAVD